MFGKVHIPLLRVEVAAARLEAAIGMDPGVEALWRAEATIAEAVASVGMEDVRVLEGDLLMKIAENRTTSLDSRGVETAWSVLRVLRGPGDILSDPITIVRRIEAACANAPGEEDDPVGDEEILDIAAAIEGMAEVPVAAAIRASALYGIISQRRSPAAERLIFCAVDAALRGRGRAPRRDDGDVELPHLHPFGRSGPIVMPATATARAGKMIWSPLRVGAISDLADALARGLSWDIGHVGVLRGHVVKLRTMGEGRHGKSRLGELVAWVMTHPVLTSGSVMEGLGLSRRGALDLIAILEGEGVLRQVTHRRTARIWATASLADRLSRRSAQAQRHLSRPPPQAELSQDLAERESERMPIDAPMRQRNLREENRDSIAKALAQMDEAMAAADHILSGIGRARVSE